MQKKLYRVELDNVEFNKSFDTKNTNYGKSFDFTSHYIFLTTYLEVMKQNDISVDFLVSLNNHICSNGNIYLEKVSKAIVDEYFVDINKVTDNAKHKNQRISLKHINYFIASLDDRNSFKEFLNGIYLWEYLLEFVRLNFFKEAPQRLDSVFFFKDIDSCNYYIQEHLSGIGKIYEVAIINEISYFEGDMKIIDNVENQIKFEDLVNEFADYWRGKLTLAPVKEIIFQGTYKYIKEL